MFYRGGVSSVLRVRCVCQRCRQPGQKQLCVAVRSYATSAVGEPHRGHVMYIRGGSWENHGIEWTSSKLCVDISAA